MFILVHVNYNTYNILFLVRLLSTTSQFKWNKFYNLPFFTYSPLTLGLCIKVQFYGSKMLALFMSVFWFYQAWKLICLYYGLFPYNIGTPPPPPLSIWELQVWCLWQESIFPYVLSVSYLFGCFFLDKYYLIFL